jgi:hypothetical protein
MAFQSSSSVQEFVEADSSQNRESFGVQMVNVRPPFATCLRHTAIGAFYSHLRAV